MILKYFQFAEASKPLQQTLAKENSYDEDTGRIDDNKVIDDPSNSPDEECDVNVDDIKIIETFVDDDPEIDIDNDPKYLKPPVDIIINTSITLDNEQINAKLGTDEDNNFFEIDNNEFDGYHEVYDDSYKEKGVYLRGCKDIKHCTRACNNVHKTLCEEFNCKKLVVTFKRSCHDKCKETFSGGDQDEEDYY